MDEPQPAQVAISLDLEMCSNFPRWEDRWDLRKGDLDEPAKQYALKVARRVHQRGGRLHFFAVGRVFEQEDMEWLQEIVALGHPVGNHTYHHVNVLAGTVPELQHTYAKWPWRGAGRSVPEIITHEIQATSEAIRQRLHVQPAGFRTPGGFLAGLQEREDLQRLLLAQGFTWVSSRYAGVTQVASGERPIEKLSDLQLAAVADAQDASQPFLYRSGLAEVPMSPLSDIHAFRGARMEVSEFLRAISAALQRVIQRGGVFDFLAHPSCLGVRDPDLRAIDHILDMVEDAGARATLATLDAVAGRVQRRHEPCERTGTE